MKYWLVCSLSATMLTGGQDEAALGIYLTNTGTFYKQYRKVRDGKMDFLLVESIIVTSHHFVEGKPAY